MQHFWGKLEPLFVYLETKVYSAAKKLDVTNIITIGRVSLREINITPNNKTKTITAPTPNFTSAFNSFLEGMNRTCETIGIMSERTVLIQRTMIGIRVNRDHASVSNIFVLLLSAILFG